MESIYTKPAVKTVDRVRIAQYVVISPQPERDVIAHMDEWARDSGLLDHPGYVKRTVGWDFPYVSKHLNEQFGMHGYVYAYVIPDKFEPACEGAALSYLEGGSYAMLTIRDPQDGPATRIPEGFRRLIEYATSDELRLEEADWGNRYPFEEQYEKDGVTSMDIYFPVKEAAQ